MLYPQNGDRIVAVDSVTSLHSMYINLQTHTRNVLLDYQKRQFLRALLSFYDCDVS